MPRTGAASEAVLPMGTGLGIVAPPPIHVESPGFEGPLATLLRCVREAKVDLARVPLAPICEAYLEYLVSVEDLDLDEAAAALIALAYLLERKAWGMLPVEEPEPEPEEPIELPESTVRDYDVAIDALRIWHEERARRFFRAPGTGPGPYELPLSLGDVKPEDLSRALLRLLNRATPSVEPLNRPRRSLAEEMRRVLASLDRSFRPIESLLIPPFTREDAVFWFLALLELIRLGRVSLRSQDGEVGFALA